MDTTAVGRVAEDTAAQWLQNHGLDIVERNARTRYFELDIVALDGETLVFVEVKYRRSRSCGGGVAAISTDKQRRLLAGAQAWQAERGESDRPMRLDIIEVLGESRHYAISHYPDCLVLDVRY